MLDLTKPVQTRNGIKARIICTDCNSMHPIVALVGIYESAFQYTREGHVFENECESPNDLINIPPKKIKKSGWINIYKDTYETYAGGVFLTKILADDFAVKRRVDCIEIHWEEDDVSGI